MKTTKIDLSIILIIGITIVLGCGQSAENKRLNDEKSQRGLKFWAARKEFGQKPATVALVKQPYLKAKVVVLTVTDGVSKDNDSPFTYREVAGLPIVADRQNSTPEEVKTVILEECKSVQKGVYRTTETPSREIPAMATNCQLTIIDRTISSVIYVKNIEGQPSQEVSVSSSANKVVSVTNKETDEFIKSLPQK